MNSENKDPNIEIQPDIIQAKQENKTFSSKKKYLLVAILLILVIVVISFLTVYLRFQTDSSGLTAKPIPSATIPLSLSQEQGCTNNEDCVLGIENNSCCSCPRAVNKQMIGQNNLVSYDSYTLPESCLHLDIYCQPCPSPMQAVCISGQCRFSDKPYVKTATVNQEADLFKYIAKVQKTDLPSDTYVSGWKVELNQDLLTDRNIKRININLQDYGSFLAERDESAMKDSVCSKTDCTWIGSAEGRPDSVTIKVSYISGQLSAAGTFRLPTDKNGKYLYSLGGNPNEKGIFLYKVDMRRFGKD